MPPTDVIRSLTPAEVEQAVEWAAREGWNPGRHDAEAFLAQDREGFLGLFRDGSLAACISAMAYAGPFAFLGFYICRPDLRGQGLGLALWNAAMARLGERVIGLDGVVAQQANYARSGFVLAHRNIRFGGHAWLAPADAPAIRIIDRTLLPQVTAYDRGCFLFDRAGFLAHWLAPPEGLALAAARADGGGGAQSAAPIAGYGVIRRAHEGWKIGPLFADDGATASSLFTALAAHAGGDPVYLDVPERNAAARALAESAGLAPVFETARMYKGPAPDLPLPRIYGITTFELG